MTGAVSLRGASCLAALIAGLGASAAHAETGNQLEEIVVTATKRPEVSRDVPIAEELHNSFIERPAFESVPLLDMDAHHDALTLQAMHRLPPSGCASAFTYSTAVTRESGIGTQSRN